MSSRRGAAIEAVLWLVAAAALLPGLLRSAWPEPRFVAGPVPRGAIRIVTWNVGAGLGGGGGLRDDHVDHIAAVLDEVDADLACLQEVRTAEQMHRLRAAAGASDLRFGAPSQSLRVAVLCRRGRLFPAMPAAPAPRSLLSRYRSAAGSELLALVIHADAFAAADRSEAIGAAADALAAADGPAARVLAGDLNLDLDLDKRRDLFSNDDHRDVATYNYVAARFDDAGRHAGPTAEPDRRLDYVLVSADRLAVVAAGVLRGRRAAGMDHDPLLVDLRWR